MDKCVKSRIIKEAQRIIETNKTLRELESEFTVGKSTIHKDMQKRLIHINIDLYNEVQNVFKSHLASRHKLGGEATKKKYKKVI